MGCNNRKKVLTTIYAVVLVLAFIGTLQMIYNAIDLFSYTTVGENAFKDLQRPLAKVTLIGALFAVLAVAGAITMLCTNNNLVKVVCFGVIAVSLIALIALIIASNGAFMKYYKDRQEGYYKEGKPYYMGNSQVAYAMYSAVVAMFLPQIGYVAVLAAMATVWFVKTLKNGNAVSQQTENVEAIQANKSE